MLVIAGNHPTDRKGKPQDGSKLPSRDMLCNWLKKKVQYVLEDIFEETRTMLTQAWHQYKKADDREEDQVVTYYLLGPQQSTRKLSPLSWEN